ncbi:hypothetical protein EV421DRAFT_1853980, partial [Armillaria borealis]
MKNQERFEKWSMIGFKPPNASRGALLFFWMEFAIAAIVGTARLSRKRILCLPLYCAEHLTARPEGSTVQSRGQPVAAVSSLHIICRSSPVTRLL